MERVFTVEVIISNKPQARDPEGETIIRDMIHKSGFSAVSEVRTGKLLAVKIQAASDEEACQKVTSMCNLLRLYNPVAHSLTVRARS
jgi:phosphoribosylformylglycinamidine synthase PurS subunit